jgi:hypothetical protein
LAQAPSRPAVAHRGLTGAQKLKRALRACRKKGKRRKACERAAHTRYARGASSSYVTSAVKRGRG